MAVKYLVSSFSLISALLLLSSPAFAISVKVKQVGGAENKVVVSSASELEVVESSRGTAKVDGRIAQMAVIEGDVSLPVIFAYKVGKKIVPAKRVLNSRSCNNAQAYTGIRGKKVNVSIDTRDEGDVAFYSGKIAKKGKSRRGLSRKSLTGLVEIDSVTCLPAGTGLTLGVGSITTQSLAAARVNAAAALDTDRDQDGLLDLVDADDDNDGILDNYDESDTLGGGPAVTLPTFRIFSNLKVGLEGVVNSKALGRSPTKDEVDMLTTSTTLAIEVKGSSPAVSELDCGSLSYCSAGGTGAELFSSVAFPGAAGGTYDSDSDGKGELSTGPTGDFQLATNLSTFSELNGGDSFVQTVTSSGTGLAVPYLASLQFAFRSTPAIKTVTFDPDGTASTTTPSYPVSSGAAGTPGGCISVSPNTDGKIIAELVAWRPERKGIPALGEADFVDLGNSRVTIDIPNEPAASGTMGGNGPGNCPASTYTESDSNLSIDADGLVDSFGDRDADAANTLTFRVDVTDCLSSAGQALDSGEEVQLDLQFRNNVGDNAAAKFCISRP